MRPLTLSLPQLLALLPLLAGLAAACSTLEDCSLNGACVRSPCAGPGPCCVCNKGWKGATCALLDRHPPPSRAEAGVWGMPLAGRPNVTSWGGNVLEDKATGLHHLYVTEIAGPNGSSCGLVSWGSHSTVVHAVSKSGLAGPYKKASVAVGHEGHNPQAVRVGDRWVIFHIGGGSAPGTPVSPCPAPPPPSCSSFHSEAQCPPKRCLWKGRACIAPPPPPTPPALCAKLTAPKGYTCTGDTCGGPSPSSGHSCGAYLTVPTLTCTDDCAEQMAALCDKDSKCHSFSLMNSHDGAGKLHSQTFAGGKGCLRTNPDWSTWVKEGHSTSSSGSGGDGDESPLYVGSEIHVSETPDGPFLPLKTTYSGCNNPSPFVMKNGTILVLCTWVILAAERLEGPWRTVHHLDISPSTRMGVAGNWEGEETCSC